MALFLVFWSGRKEKPTGPACIHRGRESVAGQASTICRASAVGKLGGVHSGGLIVVAVDGVSQEQIGAPNLDGWRDTTAKPVLHALSAAMLGPAQKLGNPSRATEALDQLPILRLFIHAED
jgi:hypothetical protein